MNNNYVTEAIKRLIEQGHCDFVIYPYGNNGRIIRKILEETFGIEPVLIVDNNLCKYNKNIISKEELKLKYDKNMYVLLGIESKDILLELKNDILQYIEDEKIVEFNNTKFTKAAQNAFSLEKIIPSLNKIDVPPEWEKLKGKKIILWTTAHDGDLLNKISERITLDLYAKPLLEYAEKNNDIGIIFRPHTTFIKELLKFKVWKPDELTVFEEYIENSPNIVWDKNLTYDNAFSLCDAILTENGCGIVCSALPLGKPLAVMLRNKNINIAAPEIVESLYKIYSQDDLVEFLDMVKKEEDSMKEIRKQAEVKFVKHFDGKNSHRIKEFIEKICKESDII